MTSVLDYYNRLQAVFPKEAATVLAELLQSSAEESRQRDIHDLRDVVHELAEAQKRTESRVEQLAEAQKRTESRVEELAEAQKRTEPRVEELAEAQKRTESRVEELAEAQKRTESALEKLAGIVGGLVPRLGAAEGELFQLRFRDRLPSYLGRFLRRAKLLSADDILDLVESVLPEEEWHDLLLADAVARGRQNDLDIFVVCEVSVTADANDIERACRRAGLLGKAGFAARPLVTCRNISAPDEDRAREAGVTVWRDGRIHT